MVADIEFLSIYSEICLGTVAFMAIVATLRQTLGESLTAYQYLITRFYRCRSGAGLRVRCWSRHFFDLPRRSHGLEANGMDAPGLLCLLSALLLKEAEQVKRTAYDKCHCSGRRDSRFLYKSCAVSFWYYFRHHISSRSNPPGGLPWVSGRHLPGVCW